jgi:TolA-binding protein
MTSKLSKIIISALAVVLVTAPLVLAQQTGSGSSGVGAGAPSSTSNRPGMNEPGTTGSTTGTQSPSMGTRGAQNAIHATVDDVNHRQHTVKLRMQDGQTVELKVPEQSLASLSKGDSVQVSIHKTAGQSNMPSTQPSRPESSPGSTGSTGTRSR